MSLSMKAEQALELAENTTADHAEYLVMRANAYALLSISESLRLLADIHAKVNGLVGVDRTR